MAGVRVTSLTKVFQGSVTALDGIDLDISEGEFFALLGPSGCGKTTTLRTIAGLERPTSGTIHIGDRDVTDVAPGDRGVGMVFQDYALYPHMTMSENIAYPLKVRRVDADERHRRAAMTAAELDLEDLLERRPSQLSGGQQQRVALARAITHEPSVFLFDEPLSNLDARLRLESRTFLKRLQSELDITTVYVTHDQAEALALADRMAVMESGNIRQVATPYEVYHRPASLFVASFIGSVPMNLLDGVVRDDQAIEVAGTELAIPEHARGLVEVGDEVVLGLRPEFAEVSDTERADALAGEVVVTELLGTDYLVTVEREGLSIQATVRGRPDVGGQVWVHPDPQHGLLYRRDSGLLVDTAAADQQDQPSDATG